jgi:hypothetical protein
VGGSGNRSTSIRSGLGGGGGERALRVPAVAGCQAVHVNNTAASKASTRH